MLARARSSGRPLWGSLSAPLSRRCVSSVGELDSIRASGRRPTRDEYESCVMAYAKTQEACTAIDVLRTMSRAGLAPSQEALRAAFGGVIRAATAKPFPYPAYDPHAEMDEPTFQVGMNQAQKPEFVEAGDARAECVAREETRRIYDAFWAFHDLGGRPTVDLMQQYADAFAKYGDRKGCLHALSQRNKMKRAAEFYQ